MDQELFSSFHRLTLAEKGPENCLSLYSDQNSIDLDDSIKFSDHKLIGQFSITKDQEYLDNNDDTAISKLIGAEEMHNLDGTFLGAGYENAVLIQDYNAYHELKYEYFLQWIVKNDYFKKVKQGIYKKPDFICFGGRISDPLQTPLKERFGEWDIYATKLMDTIFIWDKEKCSGTRSIGSFYGVAYEALMTGKNSNEVYECEKSFVIQEVTFGNHQLLVLNEIDAVDHDDEWTEIKVHKKCSPHGMRGTI